MRKMTKVWLDAGEDTKNLLLKTFNARLKPCMGKLGNTAAERLHVSYRCFVTFSTVGKLANIFWETLARTNRKVLFMFAL